MPKNHTHADDIMLNERAELNYFLGNPPSWMLRNGIIMVALFLGLLLGLSYLIKYPDVVACRVVLTTENPPIRVFAQATGRISELCIKENDPVEVGQILAVFENTADWHDVNRQKQLHTEGVISDMDFEKYQSQ